MTARGPEPVDSRCRACHVTKANCWLVVWGGFGPSDRCCTGCTHDRVGAPKPINRTRRMLDLPDSEMPR